MATKTEFPPVDRKLAPPRASFNGYKLAKLPDNSTSTRAIPEGRLQCVVPPNSSSESGGQSLSFQAISQKLSVNHLCALNVAGLDSPLVYFLDRRGVWFLSPDPKSSTAVLAHPFAELESGDGLSICACSLTSAQAPFLVVSQKGGRLAVLQAALPGSSAPVGSLRVVFAGQPLPTAGNPDFVVKSCTTGEAGGLRICVYFFTEESKAQASSFTASAAASASKSAGVGWDRERDHIEFEREGTLHMTLASGLRDVKQKGKDEKEKDKDKDKEGDTAMESESDADKVKAKPSASAPALASASAPSSDSKFSAAPSAASVPASPASSAAAPAVRSVRAQPPSSALASSRRVTTHHFAVLHLSPSPFPSASASTPSSFTLASPLVVLRCQDDAQNSAFLDTVSFLPGEREEKRGIDKGAAKSSKDQKESKSTEKETPKQKETEKAKKESAMDTRDDEDESDALDPEELARVRAALAKYTSETETDPNRNAVSYGVSADDADDEDADSIRSDEALLMLYDATNGELLSKQSLGFHQFFCEVHTPTALSIATKRDEDVFIYSVVISQASGAHTLSLSHTATFPALAYVAASKRHKKFLLTSPDLLLAAIVEHNRYAFVYSRPKPSDAWSPQFVVQLPFDEDTASAVPPATGASVARSDAICGARFYTARVGARAVHTLALLTDDALCTLTL